jgi:hypothetical protein
MWKVSFKSRRGAVNSYADGSANTTRPTALTYPNGRELTYDYGTSGSIDDHASRIASVVDEDATHLVDYLYLGRQSFVSQESLS